MTQRIFAFLALFLLLSSPAAAWWEYGHETVGRIGYEQASPRAQAAVRRLLAHSRLLQTEKCPARTPEEASYWPDCIKTLGERFSYASPWHYQNVDICKPFDLKAACRDGNCVSAQIERNLKLLADKALPTRERLMALAFLIHFVGDLHMPLHAGDKSDLGGNRFPVSYGVIAGRTNLHGTWDGWIAERGISDPPGGWRGVLSSFAPAERNAMRGGTVEDWSRESWEVSREHAYGSVMADPCGPLPATRPVIDEATTQRLIPIARRQIARGGMRLARLLDEALGA
ncbi:MAG TPA: S1/P1 nuclease [Allosphingosinicella sp.]|nr:S1/P1 nuclease [Allosphingosinicella sp.]